MDALFFPGMTFEESGYLLRRIAVRHLLVGSTASPSLAEVTEFVQGQQDKEGDDLHESKDDEASRVMCSCTPTTQALACRRAWQNIFPKITGSSAFYLLGPWLSLAESGPFAQTSPCALPWECLVRVCNECVSAWCLFLFLFLLS